MQPNLDSVYDLFKDVNSNPNHDQDDSEIMDNFNITDDVPILNSPFTKEEIEKTITLLKIINRLA